MKTRLPDGTPDLINLRAADGLEASFPSTWKALSEILAHPQSAPWNSPVNG